MIYRRIIEDCAACIAVSDQVRLSFLEEVGIPVANAERMISIPNGIEIGRETAEVDSTIRRQMGIPEDHILCVGVGRICEQKNFKDLIPVCRRLKEDGHPVSMAIAGDGPDMETFKNLIEEEDLGEMIHPLGNITNVSDLLDAADVFVMPSLWEGLPLALLEAMAAKLPVVGYRIEGLKDIIEEGGPGFLVDVGDFAGMARCLAELIRDSDLRDRMGASGRDLVERRYNLERVIDSLESLYQGILSSRV